MPPTADSTNGATQPQRQTLDLRAGVKTSGEPVYEEVLVDGLGNRTYRLAASPGLVLGVAAGDVIELIDLERECCPWIQFEVGDGSVVTLTAEGEGAAALAGMFEER